MKWARVGVLAAIMVVAIAASIWKINAPRPFAPVPTHAMPNPNAFDMLDKAGDDAKHLRDVREARWSSTSSLYSLPYSKYPPGLKNSILTSVAPDLLLARQSFAYPFMSPPHPSVYPYYAGFRELARLFAMEGSIEADRGDWNGAVNSYIDSIELGVKIARGGPIIAQLVGVACESIGRKPLWAAMSHISPDQARIAKTRLVRIEAERTAFSDTMVEEKYEQQSNLLTIFDHQDWVNEMADTIQSETGSSTGWWGREWLAWQLSATGKHGIYDEYTAYADSLIAAAEIPYGAHVPAKRVPVDVFTSSEMSMGGSDPYTVGDATRVRIVDSQTQNAFLIVQLALQQYHAQHASYPSALADLVLIDLPAAPADPFALAAPLKYVKTGKTYLLYSIGPDAIDDHGSPIAPTNGAKIGYVMQNSKGDVVAGINP